MSRWNYDDTVYSNQGFRGYNGLATFADVFVSFDVWTEILNGYMIFDQIEDNDEAEKIYNILLKRYRNNYFRFRDISTIANKMAGHVEELYQQLAVLKDFESNDKLTGTMETTKNYKTNNTQTENKDGYLTNVEEIYTDNSDLYIKMANNSIAKRRYLNDWVDGLKTMFMNKQKEVDVKAFNK